MGDSEQVARVVNDRMQERGITQRELAERSGVSVATLRKIQHGVEQTRNRSTFANISRALGFPEDHLWRIWTESAKGDDAGAEVSPSALEDLRRELVDLRHRVAAIEVQLTRPNS